MIETNKYQTQLTDELLGSLKDEVRTDLLDIINNIEFVNRLISKDRKYAKNLNRDSKGKVIVDLANPHILENMDYFRQAAMHFQKHGCYTKLMPNPNPQSEYGQWLRREVFRCWNGMIRESDGEWITGDMYFYLNYFPIIQTKIREGSKVGDRVVDFPEVWEGVYWRFHYMEQARYGGIYDDFAGAKHCCEIARRGASKSYSMGSVLTKLFILGESMISKTKVKGLVLAYQKEYLIKDGILNKFIDGITHCSKFTQFPSKKLKAAMSDMTWRAGYLDQDTGLEMGTLNEVIGIAVKDDPDKPRGKRNQKTIWEEFGTFAKFLDTWQTALPNVQEGDVAFGQNYAIGTGGSEGCLTAGNKVITGDGRMINIEDLNINDTLVGYDANNKKIAIENIEYLNKKSDVECLLIETTNGRKLECTLNHPIYSSNKSDYNGRRVFEWIESYKLNVGDLITVPNSIPYFGNESIWDPRAVGLLIGDGSYGEKQNVRIHSCDYEILDYFESRYKTTTQLSYQTKDNKTFKCLTLKGLRDDLRNIGIYGQTKNNKRLPFNYGSLSKNDLSLIIAGLFDTDGCISISYNKKRNNYNGSISLASSCKELLIEVLLSLQKFGIQSNIQTKKPNFKKTIGILDKNNYYSLEISDIDSISNFYKEIPLLIEYKKEKLKLLYENSLLKKSLRCNKEFYTEKIISIKPTGKKDIFNLTTSGTHTYLANGIITHNSDFSGALEMIQHPAGYNVYSVPNVYDKGASGNKRTIFFFPGYINSKGYYNKDGVSDVIGALISEIEHRINLKYNSSDPLQLTRRKAETAFTIQDAIMKRDGSLYPTDKLNDVINEINLNPKYTDDMWIGRLSLSKNGEVEYKPDNDLKYITEFPHKDNKIAGACCIFQMPIKNSSGSVPWGRYIAGCDPYDDDSSDTLSLMSMFILDLWTDEIVFEYTGRPMFAEDAYENIRLALLMYNCEMNYENNKKGLFNHFSKHNSLYLLSDTLEFLKDKDMAKPGLYGNKQKGTANYGNGEKAIAPYARRCIRDYLLKSQSTNVFKEIDGETIQETISVFNYQKIKSKALLQELAMWSADGNYDRCDAVAMLMLLREDKLRLLGDTSPREAGANRDIGYLGKDAFFEKNYRKDISTRSKLKF